MVTALICLLIYWRLDDGLVENPYLFRNMAAIVIFVTATRWIFLYRLTPYAHSYVVMGLLAVLALPLFFYVLGNYRSFKMFWDAGEVIPLVAGDGYDDRIGMASFFRREMIFFSVGSLVALVILPFKLVSTAWKTYNRSDSVK